MYPDFRRPVKPQFVLRVTVLWYEICISMQLACGMLELGYRHQAYGWYSRGVELLESLSTCQLVCYVMRYCSEYEPVRCLTHVTPMILMYEAKDILIGNF